MIFGIVDGVKNSSAGFKGALVHGESKLMRTLDVGHGDLHSVGDYLREYLEEAF